MRLTGSLWFHIACMNMIVTGVVCWKKQACPKWKTPYYHIIFLYLSTANKNLYSCLSHPFATQATKVKMDHFEPKYMGLTKTPIFATCLLKPPREYNEQALVPLIHFQCATWPKSASHFQENKNTDFFFRLRLRPLKWIWASGTIRCEQPHPNMQIWCKFDAHTFLLNRVELKRL